MYLFCVSLFLEFFLFIIFKSNKIIINGEENLLTAYKNDFPVVVCSWHCRFLYAIYFMKHFKHEITAISSTHEDSEIMAHILRRSKFKLIRGSSTRGWDNVIRKMIESLKNNSTIIAITNDGPKRPRHIAKENSLKIAKEYNAQIITITGDSTKKWTFNTWDQFYLPKPFGKIFINIAPIYEYEENNLVESVSSYMIEAEEEISKKDD